MTEDWKARAERAEARAAELAEERDDAQRKLKALELVVDRELKRRRRWWQRRESDNAKIRRYS